MLSRQLILVMISLHASLVLGVDHDKYWSFLESVSFSDLDKIDDGIDLEHRLAVYSVAANSMNPPRWIPEALEFLQKKITMEADIVYYLVLAEVYRRRAYTNGSESNVRFDGLFRL